MTFGACEAGALGAECGRGAHYPDMDDMKILLKITPVLFVLAGVFGFFAVGVLTHPKQVMAGAASAGVERAGFDGGALKESNCEEREVAIDEGYGVSRMAIRRFCD